MTREYIALSYGNPKEGYAEYYIYYYYLDGNNKRKLGYTQDLINCWRTLGLQSQLKQDRTDGYLTTQSSKKINKFLMMKELLK